MKKNKIIDMQKLKSEIDFEKINLTFFKEKANCQKLVN